MSQQLGIGTSSVSTPYFVIIGTNSGHSLSPFLFSLSYRGPVGSIFLQFRPSILSLLVQTANFHYRSLFFLSDSSSLLFQENRLLKIRFCVWCGNNRIHQLFTGACMLMFSIFFSIRHDENYRDSSVSPMAKNFHFFSAKQWIHMIAHILFSWVAKRINAKSQKLKKVTAFFFLKQGRIHGYLSRVWVGRGSI